MRINAVQLAASILSAASVRLGAQADAQAGDALGRQLVAQQTVSTPGAPSAINMSPTVALFRASTQDKTAEVHVSVYTSIVGSGYESLSLTATGPLIKSTGSSLLFDETGIRGSTNVGLDYSRVFFSPGDNVDPHAIEAVCERYLKKNECVRSDLPAAGKAAFDVVTHFRAGAAFGVSGSFGRQDFDRLDAASSTLDAISTTKSVYSVSAGLGTVILPLHAFAAVNFRASQSFKAGDEMQVCQAISQSTATRCKTGVLEAPVMRNVSYLNGEVRFFLTNVAVAPKAGYDFRTKHWRGEVPLYLTRDANGGFTGGLSAALEQGSSRVGFNAFVGHSLGFQLF